MLLSLIDFMFWLQAIPTGGGGATGSGGGAPAATAVASSSETGWLLQLAPFVVLAAVFYFVVLRPEKKRRKENEQMLESIRKGARVRTQGGILADVAVVRDNELVLSVTDKVRITVVRSAVVEVISGQKDEAGQVKNAASSAKSKTSKKATAKSEEAADHG